MNSYKVTMTFINLVRALDDEDDAQPVLGRGELHVITLVVWDYRDGVKAVADIGLFCLGQICVSRIFQEAGVWNILSISHIY